MKECPIQGCTFPGVHGHGTDARWLARPQTPQTVEKPSDRLSAPLAPPCDPACGPVAHVYLCQNELREAGMDNRKPRWRSA